MSFLSSYFPAFASSFAYCLEENEKTLAIPQTTEKTSKVKQIELKHKNKMLISFKLYSSTKSFNKLRGGREAKIANKNKMV